MYDYLLNVANFCKDIIIPFFGALVIISLLSYLIRKREYYKALTNFLGAVAEYLTTTAENEHKNNITNFPKGDRNE